MHRQFRDDEACHKKYGKDWEEVSWRGRTGVGAWLIGWSSDGTAVLQEGPVPHHPLCRECGATCDHLGAADGSSPRPVLMTAGRGAEAKEEAE